MYIASSIRSGIFAIVMFSAALYYSNPQYHITLKDADEGDDEKKCTLIVSLIQKFWRRKKDKPSSGKRLLIGFDIHRVRSSRFIAMFISHGHTYHSLLGHTTPIKCLGNYTPIYDLRDGIPVILYKNVYVMLIHILFNRAYISYIVHLAILLYRQSIHSICNLIGRTIFRFL